jgi:aminodeoxyfutalosine deaminase
VSPGLLHAIGALGRGPMAIHLGESAEEVRFLEGGTGPFRALLERLGAWDPAWQVPGCGPVEYLARAGLLNPRLVAVHGVQLSDDELARLAAAGATLVTCPRSNFWTGAGAPPLQRFYDSGVRVAVGTDSLASVDDLNVFSELAALRALAPDVPAGRLLESATLAGARALGFEADLGSIAPGKRADLIAVPVPRGIVDVEEYLVSGAVTVQWL